MTYEITYRYRTPGGGGGITTAYAKTRAKTEHGRNMAIAMAIKADIDACGVEFETLIDVCEFKPIVWR